MASGKNSSAPTTGEIVGGVYNLVPPVLVDGQGCAIQVDVNGKLITSGSGGGGGTTNLTGINGVAPGLTNPLPVELSDGTNPVGTAGNPLSVNVITGGGSNASVGTTGAAAPASATEIGFIDGTGKLQGPSSTNPLPITIISSSLTDPAEVAQGTTASTKIMMIGGKSNDGTPQYKEFPLGAAARSVIVEGFTGGTAIPISFGSTFVTGNITSTQNVQVSASGAQTVGIMVTGTWTGTLQPQISGDGTTWDNVGVIPYGPASASVGTITANGKYWLAVGAAQQFRILGNTIASGTAVVTLNANPSGMGALAVQSVAANLLTTAWNTDTAGQAQYNFPAGFIRTTDEPKQVFYDPFDSTIIDPNRWNNPYASGGGVFPAISGGQVSVGTGTTSGGYSYLQSRAAFTPTVPAWLGNSHAIAVENPVLINAYRFWGMGSLPSAQPTTAAPVTDAVGFELFTDGKLYAVTYINGVRTVVQDLSSTGNNKQPLDALLHRYIVYYRTDKIYWYIDNLITPVATGNFVSPVVQSLPVLYLAIAGATPPVSSVSIASTGLAVWDTGKNTTQITDGTYPWRKASITITGAQKVDGSGVVQPVMDANPANLTVLTELLSEMRAVRRLMMLTYEESGEGSPTNLFDDQEPSIIN